MNKRIIVMLGAVLGVVLMSLQNVTGQTPFLKGDKTLRFYGSYAESTDSDSSLDGGVFGASCGRFFADDVELSVELSMGFGPVYDSYILGGSFRYYKDLDDVDDIPVLGPALADAISVISSDMLLYSGGFAGGGMFDDGDRDWGGMIGPLAGAVMSLGNNSALYVEYRRPYYDGRIGNEIEALNRADEFYTGLIIRW